ncbi:MAG: enoyl-ACP reductase [Nitrospinota bacterium]
MGLLEGKKGIIFGVANKNSLSWAIAQALSEEGAELAFTYQNEVLEKRVRPLAESLNAPILEQCDVGDEEDVQKVFEKTRKGFGHLDFLIHGIAFANKEELSGRFVNTSREGFKLALDVSAYSLTLLSRYAMPLMEEKGGSILTLTYYGSEKVVPNYNVMGVAKAALETSVRYLAADLGPSGIRVNAISAGPVKTLAAMGITGFKGMLSHVAEKAPLRRNIESSEVGKTGVFLCSDLSTGMTGEILHLDAGYHTIGM